MTRIPALCVIALLGLAPALPAFADEPISDQDRDRDRDKDRLHEADMDQLRTHLEKKMKLGEPEIKSLEPELKRYFRLHGEQAHIRAMLQASVDSQCNGACLQETVRSTNRAMVWGMQDIEATKMVSEALQDRVRDRDRTGAKWTDADFANLLHDRVQDRLRLWERDRERLQTRERDAEMERSRDREMQRQQDRASGGKGRGN